MARLPELEREQLSVSQMEVFRTITDGPRGSVRGPFTMLLHSPELAKQVEQLGVFVRYCCAIPQRQRELAILVVARHWRATCEWYSHSPLALRNGIPEAAIQAIGEGSLPDLPDERDAAAYAYTMALVREGRVSDSIFANTRSLFGVQGVVDLTALIGYYTLLAFVINAFEITVPNDAQIPW